MSCFYEIFNQCKEIIFSKEFQLAIQEWISRPPLDDFENVGEILAFLNKRSNRACLEEVRRKDAVLKKLLSIHQDETVLISLEPFFLVSFKPALLKLFGHYFEDDPPDGEDLGQVIFTSFLEAINNRSLVWREKNIALNIVLDTRHKVFEWVSKLRQKSTKEILEDDDFSLIDREMKNTSPEEALVIMVDLARGFGYDEDTDHLCTRLDDLYKEGIINEMEKRILIGQLVYQKTLKDMVPQEEYWKWKKRIRLLKKSIDLTN